MARKKRNFSYQIKFLMIFSIILVLLIIGLVVLIIYNSYSFIYKEIAKLYDFDEFQQLDNIENILENIQLNLENSFKNNLQTIVNLYQNLNNLGDITINNFDLIKYEDIGEGNEPENNMIYISDNENNIDDIIINEKKIFSYLSVYLKIIFNNNDDYKQILLVCDYNSNIKFFYPGYASIFNQNFEQTKIKEYTINKIKQKINDFIMLKQILLHEINYYNNLFLLPFYDDDNYSHNNNLNELSQNIFNTNTNKINIHNLGFMILENNTDNNNEEINYNNIESKIGKIFILIGINSTSEIFNEKLNSAYNPENINILRANYLFPYELIPSENNQNCKNILNLGKTSENNKDYKYLDDCFDKEEINEDYDKTTYEKILEDFNIFKNIMDEDSQYDSTLFGFYRLLEKKLIQEKETSFNNAIYNITLINNKYCKAMKAYSPLQVIYETNYYYPIYNLNLNLIILNEDSIKTLLDKIKSIGNSTLLYGSLFTLLAAVIYLIIVFILLLYTQNEIKKPMERMNVLNNLYYNQDNKNGLYIDEFEEIIKSISFELKYDAENLKEKQEEDDTNIERENFNKDFEKNKIYNILVDKERINKMLEESNYSNEIINNANIIKIQNDTFVKKSKLFKDCIQMGDLFELNNQEQNDLIIFNKINFKDKNTLQNQNALFYKIFKKEFDEFYKEEPEDKNESDKKAKNKKKEKNSEKSVVIKDRINLDEIYDNNIEEINTNSNNINNEK